MGSRRETLLVVGFVSVCGLAVAIGRKLFNKQKELEHMQEIRQSERQGRIRAEKALRELSSSAQSQTGAGSENPNLIGMTPIAYVSSCFDQLNGAPWQPHACPSSLCRLNFVRSQALVPASLDGLSEFSHVWIVFVFNLNTNQAGKVKGKVTLPRVQQQVGVFACRTPHRPNPIGLSLCKIEKVDMDTCSLLLSQTDLVHGTVVLDIKPYIPRFDSFEQATVPQWLTNSQAKATFSVEIGEGLRQSLLQQMQEIEQSNVTKTRAGNLHLRLFDSTQVDAFLELVHQVLAHDIRRPNNKQTNSHSVKLDGVRFEYVISTSITTAAATQSNCCGNIVVTNATWEGKEKLAFS